MDLVALITALGGGATIASLIQWARGRRGDQATVAERWESGVSVFLDTAKDQVESLKADLADAQRVARKTREELDDCNARCRQLVALIDDSLRDLEARGADTTEKRQRLRAL